MSLDSKKFMNRLFRRVNGVVWDVMSGSVGLSTGDGIYTVTFAEDGSPTINVNPLADFGIALPAFATQSPTAEVGELIVGEKGIIGWVVEKLEVAYRVISIEGFSKVYSPPKVAILGGQGLLVVRNLMNLTGGAEGTANLTQNPMLMMALMKGDEGGIEKILPFLLMSSQAAPATGGATTAANPMATLLPMLMLKDGLGGKGGDIDPLMFLAMSGGFGGAGAGGMNPLVMMALMGKGGDLFGSSSSAPTALAPVPTRNGVPVLNRLG